MAEAESVTTPDPTSTDPPAAADPAATATAPDAAGPELLSSDEETALREQAGDDATKVIDGFKQAFYKKTQALAEERKQLQPVKDLHAALQDPATAAPAIRALAQQMGVPLADTSTPAPAAELTPEQIVERALPEDYRFMAPALAPALQALTDHQLQAALKPLQSETQAHQERWAQAQTDQILRQFDSERPGWRQHEAAMTTLSKKLQPNGMSEMDYLRLLHTVVTAQEKADPEAVVTKITQSTAAAAERTPTTPATRAKARPTGTPGFWEAAEAAKRGEAWED